MGVLFLVVLILLIASSVPRWKYSKGWSYYPSGLLGLLLLILLVLVLMGYVPLGF